MSLIGIRVVSIPVTDQEKAKQFYVEQLGFELVTDNPFQMFGKQFRWIEVAPHGAYTTISLTNWFPDLKPLTGLVLNTNDVNNDYELLKSRGIPFSAPPTDSHSGGGRVAFFSDPDGNRWNLTQDDGRE